MQRITISIDDDLLEMIDALSQRRGYGNRSETLRDIVREAVTRDQSSGNSHGPCLATLSYIYEPETRDLAKRLTSVQHHHYDLSVSTLHVHVDNRDCLEIAVLKGTVQAVKEFADGVISQRGVRHGNLHIMPAGVAAIKKHSAHRHS